MTPTAEGNLTRTPLVHLLVYLLDQGLTGSAVFQTPEGVKHCVYFQNGIPAKIHTGSVIAPLDRVILDMGLLDESTLRRTTVEVSKKKILHGRFLVTEGLLTQAVLLDIIAEQLVRKLVALFSLAPRPRATPSSRTRISSRPTAGPSSRRARPSPPSWRA